VSHEFMSIWPWNRQPTFTIGASDSSQRVEYSQSMKETQTTNPWKKTLKTTKNMNVFQIVGMDEMEQKSVVLFLRRKGLLRKAIHHELVAVLQENIVSYSSVTRFYRESILDLNSEESSSSPKDDGLDDVNDAILLALSDEPFSSVPFLRQIADDPQDMRSKKHSRSPTCRFSAFHSQTSDIRHQTSDIRHQRSDIRDQTSEIRHQTSDIRDQTSDIFIGFLTSSPTVRSQVKSRRVESSCRSNFATSCRPSGIKDRMRIDINPWRVMAWFYLSID
jgi:hypothetical protein